MKKTMYIQGMLSAQCSSRVSRVLNAIEGVSATVDLQEGMVALTLDRPVSDSMLASAVESEGYQVLCIR